MITLVTGGSGSGKSEFAEKILSQFPGKKYYIATMQIFDAEMEKKVDRHRELRKDKGFITIEKPNNLEEVEIEENSAVILECLTNLTANELFSENLTEEEVFQKIKNGVEKICQKSVQAVIVSGEVFSDGQEYAKETTSYIRLLGKLNNFMASISDEVVEVVYSLPLYHKKNGGGQ